MKNIVITEGQEIFTTTLIIAEGINVEHKVVMNLLRKHSNRETLKHFKNALLPKKKGEKGRSIIYATLTEHQTIFLFTLMKNSEMVLNFKDIDTSQSLIH